MNSTWHILHDTELEIAKNMSIKRTYKINLDSSKNINISRSYRANGTHYINYSIAYYSSGISFLAITQPFFVLPGWIFYGNSVARNHDFDAFLKKKNIFGGKIDVATTVAPKDLQGLETPSISWPNGWTFRVNRYQENRF